MIVPSMNDNEVRAQIKPEFDKIHKTTLVRLSDEYRKERKKLSIDKTRAYTRIYPIKTTGKNTWLIFINKRAHCKKFLDDSGTNFVCIVYCFNQTGIRVFREVGDHRTRVFSAHFFQRYNERLKLNILNTLDIVKHYFTYNNDVSEGQYPKNNKNYAVGYARDGLLLGLVESNDTWLYWKTFVNRGIVRKGQHDMEFNLIEMMIEQDMDRDPDDAGSGQVPYESPMDKLKRILGTRNE